MSSYTRWAIRTIPPINEKNLQSAVRLRLFRITSIFDVVFKNTIEVTIFTIFPSFDREKKIVNYNLNAILKRANESFF